MDFEPVTFVQIVS